MKKHGQKIVVPISLIPVSNRLSYKYSTKADLMSDKGLHGSHWVRLARVASLAGSLLLVACSSGPSREISEDTVVTASAADSHIHNSQATIRTTGAITPKINSVVAGGDIFFLESDVTLSDEARKTLRQHSEYLKQNPKQRIVVRSYSDSLGSRTFALAIAQKRLDVVVQTLREQGVQKSRIRQVMIGQLSKKQACASPLCEERGARIELRYK